MEPAAPISRVGSHCRAAVYAIAAISRLLMPRQDDIAVLKSPSPSFLRDALATSAAAAGSYSPHGCLRAWLAIARAQGRALGSPERTLLRRRSPASANRSLLTLRPVGPVPARRRAR